MDEEDKDELKYGAMISRANMTKVQAAHDAMCDMGATCKPTKSTDPDAVVYGGEVKALGNGKVGGYLVRFSTPADPDLTNDYFDASTKLVYPSILPVLYHHGFDKTLGKRQIGNARLKVDEIGAWAETQLNMRDQYEKAIYEMVRAGKLGYSSGAIAKSVTRERVGEAYHIKTWNIEECSLTPTPAEPRNGVMSLKSLIPAPGGVAEDADNKTLSALERGNEMTPEEVKAMIDAARAEDAAAVKAAETKAAELKAAEEAGYRKAVEELKGKIRSTGYSTQPLGFSEEKDALPAFKAWLKTGDVNGGLIRPPSNLGDIKAAFNVTTGASGGYMVPDPLYNQIIAKRNIASWVRAAPTQKFTTTSDHILVPVEDTSHTAFVVTNESAAYNENEGTVAQVDMALLKYTKLVKITEEFDAGENSGFDSWLASALARAEAVTENTVATTAILASATAGTAAAAQTALTVAEVERLIGTLRAGYNVNGESGFMMKNATKYYLKGVGFGTSQPWDFDGYPVYISDDMPAMTTGLRSTLFGNFNYFGVAERPGMMIQRNPYLYMANGQIGIFANIYRAYGVLQAEAFYTMAQA